MQLRKIGTILGTVTLLLPLMTTPASAHSFSKSYRGTWTAKPTYTWQKKHTKKNMATPKMKMVVRSKTVKWQFVGYLPKGYNRKAYTLKITKKNNGMYTLKGHGPYRNRNYLVKTGKTLHLGYQGGEILLKRR